MSLFALFVILFAKNMSLFAFYVHLPAFYVLIFDLYLFACLNVVYIPVCYSRFICYMPILNTIYLLTYLLHHNKKLMLVAP